RHLPYEPMMSEGGTESVFLEHGEHRGRRMGEGAELLAEQAEDEVLGSDDEAQDGIPGWVAEDEEPAGVLRNGRDRSALPRRPSARGADAVAERGHRTVALLPDLAADHVAVAGHDVRVVE